MIVVDGVHTIVLGFNKNPFSVRKSAIGSAPIVVGSGLISHRCCYIKRSTTWDEEKEAESN